MQKSLLIEGLDELVDEKRVAAGFLVNQAGEGLDVSGRTGYRVGNHRLYIRVGQIADLYGLGVDTCLAHFGQRNHERMGWADLVVPIRANAQQISLGLVPHQHFQQVDRCGVRPLQVIDKQRERMFAGSDGGYELAKSVVEPVLGFGAANFRDVGLVADNVRQVGDDIGQHPAFAAHRPLNDATQFLNPLRCLGQQQVHVVPKRLKNGEIGHASLELIELTLDEVPAASGNRFVDFVDQRGLPSTGVTGDEHHV